MSTPYTMAGWTWGDGIEVPAQSLRQMNAALVSKLGVSTNLSARGGVVAGNGDPCEITPSSGLTLAIEAGQMVIPSSTATQGVYITRAYTGAEVTLTAADGTYPRYDRIVAQIVENGDDSSTCQIVPVDGTPAASPTIPVEPSNAITLATVYVGAGVGTISAGDITDARTYTATAGGIVPLINSTYFPSVGSNYQYFHDMALSNLWTRIGDQNLPYRNAFKCTSSTRPTPVLEGTLIYETDTKLLWVWNGTAWTWSAPRGDLWGEYYTNMTDHPDDSSEDLLTETTSSSVAVYSGRMYKIEYKVKCLPSSGSATRWVFRIRDTNGGGTVRDESSFTFSSATYGEYVQGYALYRPAADENKIWCLTHQRLEGTGSLSCTDGSFRITDAGPNVMTAG